MSGARTPASDKELISLYRSGYSQKDISERYSISSKNLRTILQENGIETHRFRALDDETVNIIIQLISRGIQFCDVENVCSISFHAIRDIVARNNLQRASKRARCLEPNLSVPEDYTRNEKFLRKYLNGNSFCAVCKELSLSNEEILYEFLLLDKEQILRHKKKLKKRVLADAKLEFSPTAIAKKHVISLAIVRRILKEDASKHKGL